MNYEELQVLKRREIKLFGMMVDELIANPSTSIDKVEPIKLNGVTPYSTNAKQLLQSMNPESILKLLVDHVIVLRVTDDYTKLITVNDKNSSNTNMVSISEGVVGLLKPDFDYRKVIFSGKSLEISELLTMVKDNDLIYYKKDFKLFN